MASTMMPAIAPRACAPRAIQRTIIESGRSGEINAPRKQPDQMKQPESRARHGVVVPGIAQAEEPEDMLVEKVKPEEAVIFAWAAVHGQVEIRRHAPDGQNVPGRRDGENYKSPASHAQPLPDIQRKDLSRDC